MFLDMPGLVGEDRFDLLVVHRLQQTVRQQNVPHGREKPSHRCVDNQTIAPPDKNLPTPQAHLPAHALESVTQLPGRQDSGGPDVPQHHRCKQKDYPRHGEEHDIRGPNDARHARERLAVNACSIQRDQHRQHRQKHDQQLMAQIEYQILACAPDRSHRSTCPHARFHCELADRSIGRIQAQPHDHDTHQERQQDDVLIKSPNLAQAPLVPHQTDPLGQPRQPGEPGEQYSAQGG